MLLLRICWIVPVAVGRTDVVIIVVPRAAPAALLQDSYTTGQMPDNAIMSLPIRG